MSHRKTILLGVLAALLAPATAGAASPASATLQTDTRAHMKAEWTGSIEDPIGVYDLATFFKNDLRGGGTTIQGQDTCEAPLCDSFTVTVPDGAKQLRIVAGSDAADNISIYITDPAGKGYSLNTADVFSERTLLTDPVAGAWVVRTYGSGEFDYTGTAEVNLADDPDFVPPDDGSDALG